ncbi:hypothetical protein V9T40_006104 [Parthenolecanium corni]|uniref:RING-type E3 ubiquitin transferase n=1 Tax=Parthenolecanium corni TaxID=536013 RepID=A0AAN9TVD5_9HEMI
MTSNIADQLGVNKNWELSLYELNRSPQEAITDDTEIAVSPRSLHNELMCPICLDMLKKTMTTKECLHRFCHDCIITALRSGNKECPTCRKKLVSKRSLRPDPNFDLLISKIYPSRDEYEAHQTKVLEKLSKSHSQAALVQSINEGIKLQNQTRLQRNKKSQNDADGAGVVDSTVSETTPNDTEMPSSTLTARSTQLQPESMDTFDETPGTSNVINLVSNERNNTNSADSLTESGSMSEDSWCGPTSSDEIELVFKPHPSENNKDLIKSMKEGSIRYLKTTANATMSHLSKYLETRASIDLGSAFNNREISFSVHIAPNPGNFIGLNDSESLRNVVDKYWRNNRPLELYYTSKKKKEK